MIYATLSPSRPCWTPNRAGIDVAARLPLLATYLGHTDPKSTYWSPEEGGSPELLTLAAQRLEHAFGGQP